MYNTKDAHELGGNPANQQEESGTEGAGTSQPALRGKFDHQRRAPLQSKFQNLNMQVYGSQKLPNEWPGECQVAYRDKYMCISKFESESMHQKLYREYRNNKNAMKA